MTTEGYHRYHIATEPAPDSSDHPSRFVVHAALMPEEARAAHYCG